LEERGLGGWEVEFDLIAGMDGPVVPGGLPCHLDLSIMDQALDLRA
jgi:hypothetical protein